MTDDMRLRNFLRWTQRAYLQSVSQFARHFGRSPERISRDELREYMLYLIHKRKVAWSTYNIARCSLRFLYEETLGQSGVLQGLPCPKERKRLPVVLTLDEVAQFFAACPSPRYLTLFQCAYAGVLTTVENGGAGRLNLVALVC
jgi:site-specific recombinase XerD